MMIRWWKHSQIGVTDRQTGRQTDWTIHRAAWSQLKKSMFMKEVSSFRMGPLRKYTWRPTQINKIQTQPGPTRNHQITHHWTTHQQIRTKTPEVKPRGEQNKEQVQPKIWQEGKWTQEKEKNWDGSWSNQWKSKALKMRIKVLIATERTKNKDEEEKNEKHMQLIKELRDRKIKEPPPHTHTCTYTIKKIEDGQDGLKWPNAWCHTPKNAYQK